MTELDELIAWRRIYDLSCAYMRGQDRLDAALHASVFWPEATCDYGFFKGDPAEFVAFAQGLLKEHKANHHMIGQVHIDIEGDVAFGEVYFQAFHRIVQDGAEVDLFMSGRYVDRYERREGVWKIAHRSELIDWARTEPAADEFLATLPGVLLGARGADDRSSQRDWLRKA
jgi:hypothetical protein